MRNENKTTVSDLLKYSRNRAEKTAIKRNKFLWTHCRGGLSCFKV